MSVAGLGLFLPSVQAGDLLLKKGETTCKCTISKVGDGEIPPGGEAHVELIWKAVAVNAEFRQTATITTNDPKLRSLELDMVG